MRKQYLRGYRESLGTRLLASQSRVSAPPTARREGLVNSKGATGSPVGNNFGVKTKREEETPTLKMLTHQKHSAVHNT